MKHLRKLLLLLPVIFFISCEKEETSPDLASVNVINAAVNLPAVKVNYFGSAIIYAVYADQVNYSSNKTYSLPTGKSFPLTIVPSADTINPVFNEKIDLNNRDIYSLYIIGQLPTFEKILVRENIPGRYTDSTMGVRFINLSPNSNPVNINISGGSNEVSNLAYKQYSEFKTYPAKSTNNTYVFQVKDAATSTLLATYTLTTVRFFNVTLVVKGLAGTTTGVNAFGVFRVNNY